MTPEQFCYWLQGYVEIHGHQPNGDEWQVIKDHLQSIFHKVTPDRSKKKVITEEKPKGSEDARKKFQELIDEAQKKTDQRVNPFDRPGVYCSPGNVRIC